MLASSIGWRFQGKMAGDMPTVGPGGQDRRLLAAALLNERAAAVEFAACRPGEKARHLTLQRDAPGPRVGIRLRIRRQQSEAIRMARIGEDGRGLARFHDAPE